MSLEQLYKLNEQLKKLSKNWDKFVAEFIKENEAYLIDLNTEKLWKYGVDAKGETLGEYAPYTKAIKKALGQGYGRITDHITLYDEGDFYRKMKLVQNSIDKFSFTSTDDKNNKLTDVYGADIHGIDISANEKEMRAELFPIFEDKLRKYLSL